MEILKELLYINDKDVYTTYGAILSEESAGGNANYSALLKPPDMKEYKSVSFREEDGEKLPKKLTPALKARDIVLQFSIVADSKEDFIKKYGLFVNMLRSGWLNIRLPELNKTYKVYYSSCTEYKQLTDFDADRIAGNFKVKFREPKPTI